jgi:adenylosuccinate synthase
MHRGVQVELGTSVSPCVEVVYETLPGWEEDISGVRRYADLPLNARAYVERVEELCKVECRYLGVGPGRDAIVIKP